VEKQLQTTSHATTPQPAIKIAENTETATQAVTWDAVAALLKGELQPSSSNNIATSSDMTSVALTQENAARLTRPEKIQRPQLPPVQRVSPLQRTAILPPRVQPMRL